MNSVDYYRTLFPIKKGTKMKKILLTAALLALTAGTSFAGIANTKHNLGSISTAAIHSGNQSQICVFCHTPHNAIQNVPLWNRSGASAASAYKLYTSSKSLSTTTKGSQLYNDSQSLFCLSCHDGSISQLASRVNRQGITTDGLAINMTGGAPTWSNEGAIVGTAFTGSRMLGTNLTNTHPIGFSYGGAYTIKGATMLNTAAYVSTAFGGKTIFFKANGGTMADSMECSSCHAVHDNTYAPFLRTTNSGSTLCLACHNK